MPEKKNKTNDVIEKNDIVTLSYLLLDDKDNVVDESSEDKPLVLQYGKTSISKELEKKLKGKKVNDVIEIKQKFKTKAPLIELTLDDLDEDQFYNFKEGEVIELTIGDKPSFFTVEKFDLQAGRAFVRYKNPFEGAILTNKIIIEKIKKYKKE